MKTELTVRQIVDLGIWSQVCDYKGWNPYCINEGQIDYDEIVEFDSEFKKEEKVQEVITKQGIYDEMCRVLTEYENDNDIITELDLYEMLLKIQNNWKEVITATD